LWQLITITTLINGCKKSRNTNRTYVSLVSRMPIIVLSYPILALIVTLILTFAKVANPVTFTPGQRWLNGTLSTATSSEARSHEKVYIEYSTSRVLPESALLLSSKPDDFDKVWAKCM